MQYVEGSKTNNRYNRHGICLLRQVCWICWFLSLLRSAIHCDLAWNQAPLRILKNLRESSKHIRPYKLKLYVVHYKSVRCSIQSLDFSPGPGLLKSSSPKFRNTRNSYAYKWSEMRLSWTINDAISLTSTSGITRSTSAARSPESSDFLPLPRRIFYPYCHKQHHRQPLVVQRLWGEITGPRCPVPLKKHVVRWPPKVGWNDRWWSGTCYKLVFWRNPQTRES